MEDVVFSNMIFFHKIFQTFYINSTNPSEGGVSLFRIKPYSVYDARLNHHALSLNGILKSSFIRT